jgi:hypothetical protein
MAALTIKSFGGISPRTPARYLQDGQAQVAINCPVFTGSIQPLPDVGSAVHTLTKTGTPKTIYRFGQDTSADDRYWFHWTQDVDVCRSQISGDTSEWTFYTGDGGPKATYNAIALSGSSYPSVSRPLGLPAPSDALTVTGASFTPDTYSAELIFNSYDLDNLDASNPIKVSIAEDDVADYVDVSISDNSAATVAAALDAVTGISATQEDDTVVVKSDATGKDATLHIKVQTGTEADLDGTFSLEASPNLSATGKANTDAFVVLEDGEIGSISNGDKISVITETSTVMNEVAISFSGTLSAANLATFITSNSSGKVTAAPYGSCVVLTKGSEGGGADGFIQYKRKYGSNVVTDKKESGSESAAPAILFVTQAHVDAMEEKYIQLTINGNKEDPVYVGETAYVSNLSGYAAFGVSVETFGAIEPFAILKTYAVGTSATVSIRVGTYPTAATFNTASAKGYIDEDESTETRVYTWTWLNKESGFEVESAPAPASNSVDVRTGQNVTVSGFAAVPGGEYVVTHRRVYRAVNGVYLFVKELLASATSFTDDVEPDDLGEELPTLNWIEPPQTLRGLINLPNGLMAGFSGRDVYFCDPYHPHAWPENYVQTIDYPVVGLGRMDTTLAVLTTGTPYFIQGTHPDSMAVVKSDLEQSCVAKRSIVSMGGAVFYAAPDGLMMLSPGGSAIITENLFNYKQWQEFFKPESIHAYAQDNKYIGFYDNGTQQGGFIYDIRSKQFILHDIYAEAGYQDLQRDKLFLAFDNREVKVWEQGGAKNYRWKSKKFTMPAITGFSCAQLEAELYPMTMNIYVDGTLSHTQVVQNRNPFRLPAQVGRDWEVEVQGSYEVFSLSVAHSMSELANG